MLIDGPPHPPIDRILTLMTVWRIRDKIITTVITFTYAHSELAVLTILGLGRFEILCFIKFKLCAKVKLFVLLLCVRALPGKAVPEMTYTMLGGRLNPTHALIDGSQR